MRKQLLILLIMCGSLGASAQNTCSSAFIVGIDIYEVDTVDGTQIPAPSCFGGALPQHAEWYRYTATIDTAIVVTSDLPLNGNVDTRVQIYSGGCGALTCIASDDDSGSGWLSHVTFNVTAGNHYYIAWDDHWTATGFTFEVRYGIPIAPPEMLVSFTPLPLAASSICVVDMTGDHLDDVVSISNSNVAINVQQPGGGFTMTNIPTSLAAHMPSWSIVAGDVDGNGYNDLMYGGGSGVTFMIRGDDGNSFTQVPFTQYIFSQRTNMVDINDDGHLDAFVCHDVDANVHFLNDGNGNLTYIQGGLGPNGGNYGSLWTDFDNDGDMDMFVAKCGSSPPDVFMQNNGDGSFTDIAPMHAMADQHQSWSSAWGDYDNDGDMDVLIGSSSSNYHKLLRNDMGSFTNITVGSGIDQHTGQGIEWITHDFNNDGWLDILGGGALLVNNGDMTFTMDISVPENGPIGDLNNDGFLDIVNGSTAFLNDGNENNWVKIHTVGTVSNYSGIGARIELVSEHGTQIREVRAGDGFRYMSSLTTHFGLGTDTEIEQITIRWPSGIVQVINGLAINTTHVVIEELATTVADQEIAALTVFPNPTRDMLRVQADGIGSAEVVRILDLQGQLILRTTLNGHQVDVSGLAAGTYLLEVNTRDGALRKPFTKQ